MQKNTALILIAIMDGKFLMIRSSWDTNGLIDQDWSAIKGSGNIKYIKLNLRQVREIKSLYKEGENG